MEAVQGQEKPPEIKDNGMNKFRNTRGENAPTWIEAKTPLPTRGENAPTCKGRKRPYYLYSRRGYPENRCWGWGAGRSAGPCLRRSRFRKITAHKQHQPRRPREPPGEALANDKTRAGVSDAGP